MSVLRLAIHGAAGRMGRRLVALGSSDPELTIVAAIESASHASLGEDTGLVAGIGSLGVAISAELETDVDVVIDFSTASAVGRIVETCTQRGLPLVVATTGLDEQQVEQIRQAAKTIPLLRAPNMSLAVNLTMKLAAVAAGALKDHPTGADVEIIERHHRYKEDAPSGTALRFGQIIADVMGQTHHRHGREGRPGARPHDEIGYHAVRTGDNPGEHAIVFGLLGETVELSVRAISRDCYAHGALAAAKFVARQPAGFYGMNDVLGL